MRHSRRRAAGAVLLAGALALTGCADDGDKKGAGEPFASTYRPYPSEPFNLTNATLMDGRGNLIEDATIVVVGGQIARVGPGARTQALQGARTIDAGGKIVTPGIIDIHSHLGVYPSPSFESTSDGNEATAPNTAGVWAEHSVWPQDPGFTRALAGGVTTLQILPGSANLFGGRTVTLKNVPARTVQDMKFPGAPHGLKMACGENPKRVYGDQGGPATRMGNMRGYREAFAEAEQYRAKLQAAAEEEGTPPARDLDMETLAGVLDGDVRVHMHCYRADEMVQIIDLAKEFGYEIASFQHAVEAYKIADYLADEEICAAVWADWWGFKLEAYDATTANAALVAAQPGGCAIIHSDSARGIQRLNQEAAKAMRAGRDLGLEIRPEEAIRWITLNPAISMGVADRTGSIAPGKMADMVIWDADPFSIYAKPEQVFIDGALMYDANDPAVSPRSDFELAQRGLPGTGGAGQ